MTGRPPGASRLPSLGPNGEGWVVLQGLLLVALLLAGLAGRATPAWGEPWATLGRVAGGILIVVGLAFATLGIVGLRENLTPNPRPKAGGRLVDTGVYGIVRHPIYTGLIAAGFGWAQVTASVAAVAIAGVLFVFFDVKARREEAWLVAAFPGYAAYRRRVRKLIPLVY